MQVVRVDTDTDLVEEVARLLAQDKDPRGLQTDVSAGTGSGASMSDESLEQADSAVGDEPHERLGKKIHTFRSKPRTAKAPRRTLEITGVGGAAMVALTINRKLAPITTIEVFERGILCTHGKASREIMWNAVVDIARQRVDLPGGKTTTSLVLEVVDAPPLPIMIGGVFSDTDAPGKLVQALGDVWLPLWCRRARAMVGAEHTLQLGKVRLGCDCLRLAEERMAWSDVQGYEPDDQGDRLRTRSGIKVVETNGQSLPFPSTARRIAALAVEPPARNLLPVLLLQHPSMRHRLAASVTP
ncbi:MAG: hypothetical protein MUF54_26115 [Polyangiaceae bacterium]|nr:hypothetical protein [Polyangiaceae bacterium]